MENFPGFRWQPYDTNGAIAVKKEIILRGKNAFHLLPSPLKSLKRKKLNILFGTFAAPALPLPFARIVV